MEVRGHESKTCSCLISVSLLKKVIDKKVRVRSEVSSSNFHDPDYSLPLNSDITRINMGYSMFKIFDY